MPERIGLCIEDWPPPDREAWRAATARDDFFSRDAHSSHWSVKTTYQACSAYGRWLAYLANEAPGELDNAAGDRISSVNMTRYCTRLEMRISTMAIAAELNHLALALRAIAPRAAMGELKKRQRFYARKAEPRERRGKILDAKRLFGLGLTLMEQASEEPRKAVARVLFRDGLMIALLAARPLRRRNFASIEIGVHLIPTHNGFDLFFPYSSTKTGEPIEFAVPSGLVLYLKRYLTEYRNLFPGTQCHVGLWASAKGCPLGADAVYGQISKRTEAAFGVPISPHLFRSSAATTLAHRSAADSQIASSLLGHTKPSTTDQFYRHAKSIEASRVYASLTAPTRRK